MPVPVVQFEDRLLGPINQQLTHCGEFTLQFSHKLTQRRWAVLAHTNRHNRDAPAALHRPPSYVSRVPERV
jgi:hypothetical protein